MDILVPNSKHQPYDWTPRPVVDVERCDYIGDEPSGLSRSQKIVWAFAGLAAWYHGYIPRPFAMIRKPPAHKPSLHPQASAGPQA